MRIALVSPVAFPTVAGNAVTVGRLRRGLAARGAKVEVLDLSRIPADRLAADLDRFRPEIVHAFHAFRGAPAVVPYTRERALPLVVSLTGTDANVDLFDPDRRAATVAVIREARALVVFHASIRAKVAREVPEAGSRINVIPQSVALEAAPYDASALAPRRPGEVWFLLPSGIRHVKNPLLPVRPLGRLAARYPLRLLIAGPVIEEDEAARLREALKGADWASYVGEVPHEQMASLLDQADVVVNSSRSEGGMANAVLEAMSRGRAVLASDIEGNRSVIEHGVDGLLFTDPADFERQAERLLRDPALRAGLGVAGRRKVDARYGPAREIDAYLALYRRLRNGDGP